MIKTFEEFFDECERLGITLEIPQGIVDIKPLNPDMPAQEMLVARAAIRWANFQSGCNEGDSGVE